MKSFTVAAVTAVAGTCLLTACAEHPSRSRPADQSSCVPDSFGPPFTAVDPCSAEAVMSAAVATMFTYRPAEDVDQRRAFAAATPLLDPEFARTGAPAAVVLAPITPGTWAQWRDHGVTVAATARAAADDHPPDTASRAARVVTVTVRPSDGTASLPLVMFVLARRTQTSGGARWLVSNVQVAS